MRYDPVTFKVVWDRLVSITEEAAATLVRTAFSTVVREVNDYACLLLDNQGNSLAQPRTSIASFIGTMPVTVKEILKQHPVETMKPGDSFITNDPWLGTGQLPDFTIATPIFDDADHVIAIAGTIAHMPDIGGAIRGGYVREVYEEGLAIPILKLVKGGELNEDLLAVIRQNVRVPDQVVGDTMAMLAANYTAAKGLRTLMAEGLIDDVNEVAREIHDRSEAAMRAAIEQVPNGEYFGEVTVDNRSGPYTIKLRLVIQDQQVIADFAGSSPQTDSSINSVYNYTFAFTVYPLKCLLHPQLPNNEGCFKPFILNAPEGTIVNAKRPQAVDQRNRVGHVISCAVFSALARVMPNRIMAHSGSAPLTSEKFIGVTQTGRHFAQTIAANGGTGACPSKDGEICSYPSNLSNSPIEIVESSVPLRVEEKRLIPDSAGPGRFRGGYGQRISVRNVGTRRVFYSCMHHRLNYPALGLLGGGAGRPNFVSANGRPLGEPMAQIEMQPGDLITIDCAGGGGLHPPTERDHARVLEELADGLVTPEAAQKVYGLSAEEIAGVEGGAR